MIKTIFFSGMRLPSIRMLTALGLYFDRIIIPVFKSEHVSLDDLAKFFHKPEQNFFKKSLHFVEQFKALEPEPFMFIDPFPDSFGIHLTDEQAKKFKNLNIFPSPFLLSILIHASIAGFYAGHEDAVQESGFSDQLIPLSFEENNFYSPPFLHDDKILADFLSSTLALEAIQLSLPDLEAISPEDILWAKEKLNDELVAFRSAMYTLSIELRSLLENEMDQKEIFKEVSFIVKTRVQPRVLALKQRIEAEKRSFSRRIVLKALDTFKLIAKYVISPDPIQLAKITSDMAAGFISYEDYRDRIFNIKNENAISYLANLHKHVGKK